MFSMRPPFSKGPHRARPQRWLLAFPYAEWLAFNVLIVLPVSSHAAVAPGRINKGCVQQVGPWAAHLSADAEGLVLCDVLAGDELPNQDAIAPDVGLDGCTLVTHNLQADTHSVTGVLLGTDSLALRGTRKVPVSPSTGFALSMVSDISSVQYKTITQGGEQPQYHGGEPLYLGGDHPLHPTGCAEWVTRC